MAHLSLKLLGPFRATQEGKSLTNFESDRARALLAYLTVAAEQPHPRPQLAALLWPDRPESSARANLRAVLSKLRTALQERSAKAPYLIANRQTIQFNRTSDYCLDVTDFDRSIKVERDTLDAGSVMQLEQAVTLYRGPFLDSFFLDGCAEFEEWLLLTRERLQRQMLGALHLLAEYFERNGDYAQARHYAERQIEIDPFQERAHQQIMRLFAANGQRSQALAHYNACQRILATELGIEPSDETVTLAKVIRKGALFGHVKRDQQQSAATHLPHALSPLIGRKREMEELVRLLAGPELRLITVIGPGGIGKSRLALAAASTQEQHFTHGVHLISLAPVQSIDGLVPAIARALRFSFYEDSTPRQQLLAYLQKKEMLLVMDNFEHLLDGVALLIEILQIAPGVKVFATSRMRLEVPGEQLYPLAGLAYPNQQDSSAIAPEKDEEKYGAVALFCQQARRTQPGFLLRGDSEPDVVHICRILQGMPLGILLASSWLEILTPAEIANELARDFRFLRMDDRGLPERHQSLKAVFDHSWLLLTPDEQDIFLRFSLFRGGCTRDAAQAVAGATLTDLLTLTRKFFLQHRRVDGASSAERYEVHELLRQFAAQKLSQSVNDERTARQHHGGYYLAFVSQRESELKGSRQLEVLTEIEAESENVRLAWQWAIEQAQFELLDQAAGGLGLFYEWHGRYEDGERACRTAAESLEEKALSDNLALCAKLLRWQARFNHRLGNGELAMQLVKRSLDLLDSPLLHEQDIRAKKAASLLEMAEQTANHTDSIRWLRYALNLFRDIGDDWGTAHTLHPLGNKLSARRGMDAEGQKHLEESFELYQSLGDRRGAAKVLVEIGTYAMLRGQHQKGEACLRESLAIRREVSREIDITYGLYALAHGLMLCGKFTEAFTIVEECRLRSQDIGNRPLLASVCNMVANIALHVGRYEYAHEQVSKGLQQSKAIGHDGRVSFGLWILGNTMMAKRAHNEAEQFLQESISIDRKMGFQTRINGILTSLGSVAYALGQIHQARCCLAEALELCIEDRFWFNALRSILLAALLAVEEGDPERAVELYALALCAPHVANSPWYEEVAGRHVKAAAESLAPEHVAAAQERGKARDLWKTIEELLEIYV